MQTKKLINIVIYPLMAFTLMLWTMMFVASYSYGAVVAYAFSYFMIFAGVFFSKAVSILINSFVSYTLNKEPSVTQAMQPAQKQITMEIIRTIQKVFSDVLGREGLVYVGDGKFRLDGISIDKITQDLELEVEGQKIGLKRFRIGNVSVFFKEKDGFLEVFNMVETTHVINDDATVLYHFRMGERDEYYFSSQNEDALIPIRDFPIGRYEDYDASIQSPEQIFEWAKLKSRNLSNEESYIEYNRMKQFFPLDHTNGYDCSIAASSLEQTILQRLQNSSALDDNGQERAKARLVEVGKMLENKDNTFPSSAGWDVVVDKIESSHGYSEEYLLGVLIGLCIDKEKLVEIEAIEVDQYKAEVSKGDGKKSVNFPESYNLTFSKITDGYVFYIECDGHFYTVNQDDLLELSVLQFEGSLFKLSLDAMRPVSFVDKENGIVTVRFNKQHDLLLKSTLKRQGFEYVPGRGLQKMDEKYSEIDDILLPFAVSNEYGHWTFDGGLTQERECWKQASSVSELDVDISRIFGELKKEKDVICRGSRSTKHHDIIKSIYKNNKHEWHKTIDMPDLDDNPSNENLDKIIEKHVFQEDFYDQGDQICMASSGDLLLVYVVSSNGDAHPINRDAFYRALSSIGKSENISGFHLLHYQNNSGSRYFPENPASLRQLKLMMLDTNFKDSWLNLALKFQIFSLGENWFRKVFCVALLLMFTFGAFFLFGSSFLSLFEVLFVERRSLMIILAYTHVDYFYRLFSQADVEEEVKSAESSLFREDFMDSSTAEYHMDRLGMKSNQFLESSTKAILKRKQASSSSQDERDSAKWLGRLFDYPTKPRIVIECESLCSASEDSEGDSDVDCSLVEGAASSCV